jgi:hypothetical protein
MFPRIPRIRRVLVTGLLGAVLILPPGGALLSHAATPAHAALDPDTVAGSGLNSFRRSSLTPTKSPIPTSSPSATATAAPSSTATPAPSPTVSATPSPAPPVSGSSVATLLAGLRVMNYYPAANNWANMWTNLDPATIDADFGRIAALHANAVRIILQAWTIGYPTPQPTMLDHLSQMIAMASNHGLRVQLNLFDWWSSYTDISGSKQWASAVLSPYAGDSRIAFIELRNEIDTTDSTAMTWAQQKIPYIKSIDGGIPVTISVTGQESVSIPTIVSVLRAAPPDFYDYHYYGSASLAYSAFQQAMQAVAPASLFIGETGFSSSLSNTGVYGLPDTTPALEAYEDYYYRAVDNAARSLGLPQVAPWTLSDFVPGSITWVPASSLEYGFGLYHTDGSAKAVAASVAGAFGGGAIDTSFNNGFEICAGGTPAIWQLFHATQATFACDTSVAHSGGASARISNSSGDSTGVPAFFLSPTVARVAPGQVHTVSVWARGQNATGTTQVALAWFDANGNYLSVTDSPALQTGTTSWTLLTASGPAPAGAAYVQIHCESAYNSGTAWFDDVSYQ